MQKPRQDSHLNPTHSSLSLQLENGSFLTSDTCLDHIQLDDLVAPTHDCSCFKLPPIRLKTPKLHYRHKENQSSEKLDSVLSRYSLPNNQITVNTTSTGKTPPPQPQQQPQQQSINRPNDFNNNDTPTQPNTNTNKLSISSIKLEVPVLNFTNSTIQDSSSIQQIHRNKFHWTLKRLCMCKKKHDWKWKNVTHKPHSEQLKQLSWQILWYILTTTFISISFVCFIECVPNIYVYTYWDNSTFQVNFKYYL
ncbi:unnamed protein product [Schistosoma turkestanicum]|nr:unnamed protein product [Schistosoma turkestanicum]